MAFWGMTPKRADPEVQEVLETGFRGGGGAPARPLCRPPPGPTDRIFRSGAASEEKGPFVSVTQLLPASSPAGLEHWLVPGRGWLGPAHPRL